MDPPAWKSPLAVVLFVAIAAAALAGDLWSKHAVFASQLDQPAVRLRVAEILAEHGPDVAPRQMLKALDLHQQVFTGFRLTLSTNPGVVFGLPMPPLVVGLVTVVMILLVGWFFAVSDAAARSTHVSLGLILAGAIGNFYDRMIAAVHVPGLAEPITGQVRDFLDFSQVYVGGFNYPYVFNVADVWLVIGVAVLLLHWILAGRARDRAARTEHSAR